MSWSDWPARRPDPDAGREPEPEREPIASGSILTDAQVPASRTEPAVAGTSQGGGQSGQASLAADQTEPAVAGTSQGGGQPGQASVVEDRADGTGEPDPVVADEAFLAAVAAEFDAVQSALVRLDDGSFDRCQTCGGRITQEQLAADPLTTRCPAHA